MQNRDRDAGDQLRKRERIQRRRRVSKAINDKHCDNRRRKRDAKIRNDFRRLALSAENEKRKEAETTTAKEVASTTASEKTLASGDASGKKEGER